MLQIQSRPL